jgi:hypothetical protein
MAGHRPNNFAGHVLHENESVREVARQLGLQKHHQALSDYMHGGIELLLESHL